MVDNSSMSPAPYSEGGFDWYAPEAPTPPGEGEPPGANSTPAARAPAHRRRDAALSVPSLTLGCIAVGIAVGAIFAVVAHASLIAAIAETACGFTAGWITSDAIKAYARTRRYRGYEQHVHQHTRREPRSAGRPGSCHPWSAAQRSRFRGRRISRPPRGATFDGS